MRYIKIKGGNEYLEEYFEVYVKTNASNNELNILTADLTKENNDLCEYKVWGSGVTTPEQYALMNDISVREAKEMKEDFYTSSWGKWEEIAEEQYLKGSEIF